MTQNLPKEDPRIPPGFDILFVEGTEDSDVIDTRLLQSDAGQMIAVFGKGSNDIIKGGTGQFWADGGDDNDLILGGENASNYLYGGEGGDKLIGGMLDDVLDGGAGDDVLRGGDGNDRIIDLSTGFFGNTLSGGNGNDTLISGIGHDFIYGNAGNDSIEAGGGNDYIDPGVGSNTVYAGEGDDSILFDHDYNSPDHEFPESSTDLSYELIYLNNVLYGEGGSDRIDGGPGFDKIYGGKGNDHLAGARGSDAIWGEDGNDLMYGDDRHDAFVSLHNADGANNFLDGGDGNDTIYGGNGSDWIYGGSGTNILYGDNGYGMFVWAKGGNDTIYDGDGDSTIWGEQGNDSLYGGAGHDEIYGGYGNDYINDARSDGSESAFIDGGNGIDIFALSDGGAPISIEKDGDGYILSGVIKLINIELLSMAGYVTDIEWWYNMTHMYMAIPLGVLDIPPPRYTMDDYYDSDKGDLDTNAPPPEDDGLPPLPPADEYNPQDEVPADGETEEIEFNATPSAPFQRDVSGNTPAYTIPEPSTNETEQDPASEALPPAAEPSLPVSESNNQPIESSPTPPITAWNAEKLVRVKSKSAAGHHANDEIIGNAQNNKLNARGGDDLVTGKNGHDSVIGGSGDDTLFGGAGKDTLHGGSGDDLLFGNKGNDNFLFNGGHDTVTGGAGKDVFKTTFALENSRVHINEDSHLVITFDDENSVTLLDEIERFQFSDDTHVTYDDLMAMLF